MLHGRTQSANAKDCAESVGQPLFIEEYFLQVHIDTLADKVLKRGGYGGEIYWLTADEINALILLLMKELESKTDKELI